MRLLLGFLAAGVLAVMLPVFGVASATNVYIAQTTAGSADGSSCANAYAVTFFNSSGNWGSSANQIGPGTVVYLCGTITSPLQINGSGTSGNPIEVLWTAGTRISVPHGRIINLNGSYGYLLFDGGTACGPATSCDTVETANQTGYATGQAGIIEATANGSALANQDISTQAFYGCNLCHDIEVRNLIVRNLYVHSGISDSTSSADTGTFIFQCGAGNNGCASGTISIHDSTVHDTGNAISIEKVSSTNVNVYNIDFYHNNWAMENSGSGTRTLNFHDNHIHDTSNWDTTADAFHHNGLHNYMTTASDSVAINFYNNLSDGNWGSCCTTDTSLFVELSLPDNINVFNNVCIQYNGNVAPCWGYYATTGVFANNTAIGATVTGNVKAIEVGGTNITFENNTVENYGQFIVVDGGTTFTVFDYDIWGPDNYDGNDPWAYGPTGAGSFPAWQSACSCDSHGGQIASLGVNSSGIPQSGSALIGKGAQLTSIVGQLTGIVGMIALDSGTSAGDTNTPVARPASGAWDVGAFQYSASTIVNPPTSIIAAAQ